MRSHKIFQVVFQVSCHKHYYHLKQLIMRLQMPVQRRVLRSDVQSNHGVLFHPVGDDPERPMAQWGLDEEASCTCEEWLDPCGKRHSQCCEAKRTVWNYCPERIDVELSGRSLEGLYFEPFYTTSGHVAGSEAYAIQGLAPVCVFPSNWRETHAVLNKKIVKPQPFPVEYWMGKKILPEWFQVPHVPQHYRSLFWLLHNGPVVWGEPVEHRPPPSPAYTPTSPAYSPTSPSYEEWSDDEADDDDVVVVVDLGGTKV